MGEEDWTSTRCRVPPLPAECRQGRSGQSHLQRATNGVIEWSGDILRFKEADVFKVVKYAECTGRAKIVKRVSFTKPKPKLLGIFCIFL